MKHTDIRAAVLDALEQHEHGATLFDGRPVVFDEEDFPAIAVYLTDAGKRLVRTVLIFTESSDQLSRATDRVPGLPA
ncbi:phage minor tail U family protein, partial [Escherichia coli]|uniref:phage minor tail U family protein n=1 Tax=Escherichia coli TaxID=562 RepID=UPI000B32D2C3